MRLPLLAVLAVVVCAAGSTAGAAREYRVALVLDPEAFTAIPRQEVAGLRRASQDFGVEARVVVQPIRTSSTSTFRTLAREGYDLVVAGSALLANGALTAAESNPDTRFALLDVGPVEAPEPLPGNVVALRFREEEIGFVAGYLAGLVERSREGPDVVASVGGFRFPPVDRFIAGFRAGARRASPRVRHLNAYSGTFLDPSSCARVATAQIAKGAGVVFAIAGRCERGALVAAKRHGIFGVGTDADWSSLGPHVLTSALKRFDIAVYRTVGLDVRGQLGTGSAMSLGLREAALGLGRISPRVPPSLVARTRAIMRRIASGDIAGIPTRLGE